MLVRKPKVKPPFERFFLVLALAVLAYIFYEARDSLIPSKETALSVVGFTIIEPAKTQGRAVQCGDEITINYNVIINETPRIKAIDANSAIAHFTVGLKESSETLERAVIGMKVGEVRDVEVPVFDMVEILRRYNIPIPTRSKIIMRARLTEVLPPEEEDEPVDCSDWGQ